MSTMSVSETGSGLYRLVDEAADPHKVYASPGDAIFEAEARQALVTDIGGGGWSDPG